MRLFLVLVVVTAVTGKKLPEFFREKDGSIRVLCQCILSDLKDSHDVSLIVANEDSQAAPVSLTKTDDGQWKVVLNKVKTKHGGVLNYVLQYHKFNTLHQLARSTEVFNLPELPPSQRFLQRRATVVFFDDFSSGKVDPSKWQHAITGDGGGNHGFSMYTPEAANSYVKDGVLYIHPTLTVDRFGANFLSNGNLDVKAIWGSCTDNARSGCHLQGHSIPPIMSAKLSSTQHIRYGKIEVVAKLPKGDWLWPAIWMMPTEKHYGGWPASGEIDIMEARGNLHYHSPEGWTMGADVDYSTVHYGPAWNNKKSFGSPYTLRGTTFADAYHTFWIDWTQNYIKIGVDDHTSIAHNTPAAGYWHEGQFSGTNIWASGGKDAPFDRPFYLILSLGVGGAWFNHANTNQPYAQPWSDGGSDTAMRTAFWDARHLWQATWHGDDVAMKVRSVKMTQY
ncbi:hypothetical protein C0Q70_18727 [Pomacea canaliculata]|uniref:GH16 domain-containing protein n=1 Tax=Pomacea canaliculata TaxID=400727 RepID=A0A2T7NHC3_POMCA|nr:hypothetical protein C0Q70_18727 [Pomacea canaliculata]